MKSDRLFMLCINQHRLLKKHMYFSEKGIALSNLSIYYRVSTLAGKARNA